MSDPAHAADRHAAAPDDPLDLSMLPEPPDTSPDPWVPYAVEKAMGAQLCPEDPDDRRGRTGGGGYLHRPCIGLLPRHLADVLVAIPTEDIFLPVETRTELARQPQQYLAIPGAGSRPDFMADVDVQEGITLRSFEGKDPADTLYLVIGPFRCVDDDPSADREGEFALETTACRSARNEIRLYAREQDGSMRDVSREYLPEPELTPAEQALVGPFRLDLDVTRLAYVPVLRWVVHIWNRSSADDPPDPMPEWVPISKNLGESLHLGFAAWNGERFEVFDRLSRHSWPGKFCNRHRPDSDCGRLGSDRVGDPFVDEEADGPPARDAQ